MLESIRITNFAIISKSSITFSNGFNVLTGETGAGKSLIVDALLFLTGVRADKTFIKSGEDFSRVEGVFSVDENDKNISDILSSIDLQTEGTLIISRQFNLSGKNECRINGELVTLNIIRKLSSHIIDIFGQNDSQVLLDSTNHISLLDNMFECSLVNAKNKLCILLDELKEINSNIQELGGLDKDRENNIRFIEFQIDEIDSADLHVGDEEQLKSKILSMQNSEKILTALENSSQVLDGEYSIENAIKTAINNILSIENYNESYSTIKERLYSVRYELQDIVSEIASKKDSVIYDEEELDLLQDKLIAIKDLERKYGNSIEEILLTRDKLNIQLEKLLNADAELERLRLNKNDILKKIYNTCIELHEIRESECQKFKDNLECELRNLGMKNARFEVEFLNKITLDSIESEVNSSGADRLQFLFSANLGVEPRPLDKIISGGEMSRFMLAFKTLQNNDNIKTCIFDEVDTGIGGEIGNVVGKKICKIASMNQVICITHLPQIACFGDSNFKIEKYDENNVTITTVSILSHEDKIKEIARMLSGTISELSIEHAKELIDDAEGFKRHIS
jgi:DNA repair protein RecN (Recombination protein N)